MSPRSPAKQGGDALKLAALTRDDVAKRLGGLRWEVFVRLGEEPS